ncbi:MAG TPA: hypothetical protein VK142_11765 [Bacillota bacterium]|nr:hypothetical protein [Bacillota bacterium]
MKPDWERRCSISIVRVLELTGRIIVDNGCQRDASMERGRTVNTVRDGDSLDKDGIKDCFQWLLVETL